MKNYSESLIDLSRNQSVSYWLKEAVLALDSRDALDALWDAQILLEYAKAKARQCGISG